MKSVGLIVEYNPFHNGHLYHLMQSKVISEADVVIVVMSGHFTQRGEAVVTSKWSRTEMALSNGADLVVELPYAYSTQHASLFALGAISILNHLHVDSVVFGSECGNIETLREYQHLLASDDYQQQFKHFLSLGHSVPRASEKAMNAHLQQTTFKASPNDTLGLHYLNAIDTLQASIVPQTIKRLHSDYHEQTPLHHEITSATSVRSLRAQGESIASYVPSTVHQLLEQDIKTSDVIHDFEVYFPFLKQKVLTLTPTGLHEIHDMTEGLEHRIYQAMLSSSSFHEFIAAVKTKRYTLTRLQRLCAHILTHTTKAQIASYELEAGATYIRVLGTTTLGRRYLKSIKKQLTIPLFSTYSSKVPAMLTHELAVTAAYSAPLPEPLATHLIEREYKQFPLHIEQT